MAGDVTLTLTRDQAVVLFEWLARCNEEEGFGIEDPAEQRVLWDLEASLESTLVEPFKPEYEQLLAAARARVRDSADRS